MTECFFFNEGQRKKKEYHLCCLCGNNGRLQRIISVNVSPLAGGWGAGGHNRLDRWRSSIRSGRSGPKRQRAASHTESNHPRLFTSPSGMKLTVKRGVSFLMSPRLTSIPITPRISWFWCWRERGLGGGVETHKVKLQLVAKKPDVRFGLRRLEKASVGSPRRSGRLWSLFC